ncbi:hypothetical protein BC332_19136 [Capsicum chinense]|nr:hypothetical protein BC332_19136 [Capsicum chinense]
MGAFTKLLDLLLFIYLFFIAIVAPLIDGQTVLPSHIFPSVLVDLKNWYTQKYGHYLVSEKPHFFVGLVWLELFFAWPLCVLSLYAIAAGKSWINTTCLLYGVSILTSLVFYQSHFDRNFVVQHGFAPIGHVRACHSASVPANFRATNSDSIVDLAMIVCLADLYDTAPPPSVNT